MAGAGPPAVIASCTSRNAVRNSVAEAYRCMQSSWQAFKTTAFNIAAGGAADAHVYAVALQRDGKILIGGDFGQVHKVERNRVARLNPDGSLDPTFNPGDGPNTGVRCLAVQPDGKVLIGGIFISVQGVARNRVARLNADGSLDASFDPGAGANEVVRWVGLQPDGKILATGGFRDFAGVECARIARLRGDSVSAAK